MKKTTLTALFALTCLLATGPALADETGGVWGGMKNKLERLTPQKKTATTTAVGGVRGAKDQAADSLYWKNEEKKQLIDETEYSRFNEAYQLAVAGNKQSAIDKFTAFLTDYPKSSLREDALLAISTLTTSEPAAAPQK